MESEQLTRVERLLTEIRDLQQAHFDRYKEFTGRLMESDQRNQQAAAAAAQTNDAFVSEQLAYQDEWRRHMRNSQMIAVVSSIGIAIVTGVAIFAALLASRMLP